MHKLGSSADRAAQGSLCSALPGVGHCCVCGFETHEEAGRRCVWRRMVVEGWESEMI